MRACKDCQWWVKEGHAPFSDMRPCVFMPWPIYKSSQDYCGQFHRREDGEDVRTVAKPADS